MIDVVLIGAGNVAIHLARALSTAKDIRLIQRYNRSTRNREYFDAKLPFTDSIRELQKADIYLVSVKDDAIAEVTSAIGKTSALVVHTSGSKGIDTIQSDSPKGVFYPLQSFSAEKEIRFNEIPICIETDSDKELPVLRKLATSLSDHVYELDGAQRKKLHIAAVFANNFANHMFAIANDICQENGIDFNILKPLIRETALKIETLDPVEAQTGPARRNDQKVIRSHTEQLQGLRKDIYQLITKSISETYN